MLDDMFHRLSSRFTTNMGTEWGNRGNKRGDSPATEEQQGKGRHGNKTGQRHRRRNNGRQKGNRNCNMQSWERAKPLSRPGVFLETGGGCPVGMCCEGGNKLGFPIAFLCPCTYAS